MSTLKVNAIEPYSGGTVTITGASIESASYAETANSLTPGMKSISQLTITGGTGSDLIVTGSGLFSGNAASNGSVVAGTTNKAYLNSQFIGLINGTTSDEIGFTDNGNDYGVSGWAGPSIYANDPTDSYPALIGFQNKADWTDGKVTVLAPLGVNGPLTQAGGTSTFENLQTNAGYVTRFVAYDADAVATQRPILDIANDAGASFGVANVTVDGTFTVKNGSAIFNGNTSAPDVSFYVGGQGNPPRIEVPNPALAAIFGHDVGLYGQVKILDTPGAPGGATGSLEVNGPFTVNDTANSPASMTFNTAGGFIVNGNNGSSSFDVYTSNATVDDTTGTGYTSFKLNKDYFSEYYGNLLSFNEGSGRSALDMKATVKADLSLNAWSGSYDNYLLIKNDETGTTFSDWILPTFEQTPWMTVPQQGSVTINRALKLDAQDPLPTGAVGELAVSASNLYYHNGSTWSQIN
jgi:hypothetical protein